ncbi:MAG: ABC transporter permease [Candidatus Cloacimonadota bacterium]|nr:MAG: ABC transporter permease [Candidatus Cloacimonadota bacterium]
MSKEKKYGLEQDNINGKVYDGKMIIRLIGYLKPYKFHVFFAALLLFILTGIALVMPLITQTAIDKFIVSDISIVKLSDSELAVFKKKYGKLKLEIYETKKINYVLIPNKKRFKIEDKDFELWKKDGKTVNERYIFIANTEENRNLLKNFESCALNDKKLAVPERIISEINEKKLLSPEQIRTLRESSLHGILIFGIIYFALIILRFIVEYAQIYIVNYASQRAMYDLRRDLFKRLNHMPCSFFDKNPVGRLVTRVTNDVRTLDEMLGNGFISIVQDLGILCGIIVIMLVLNWRLALVSFTVMPFVGLALYFFRIESRKVYRSVRKKLAELNARLSEDISGVKIIRLFNQYNNRLKDYRKINKEYYDLSLKQLKIMAVFRPLINAFKYFILALILWYGGGEVLKNYLSLGMLMAFIRYIEQFFEPLNRISERFNVLQSAMSGAERIFDLMDKPVADYHFGKTSDSKLKGDIELKDIWLSYGQNEDYQLKGINLKIKAGEKIALVGHTGSGKTSVINLICGMYPFQKGDLLIDGKSIKDYDLKDLRSNIGTVQQEVFLFSGTVRENITLGDTSITDEKLEEIARYVNVHNFINSQKQKYDEPVMERGATFSVGQRQLISFARVLAYDPAVFVFDEATSNIDTETELLIQDAIEKLMRGRTSVIIAHRLSTIRNADRIIVLHKGEIAEQGSHKELLEAKGKYYDLYRLQYKPA